MSEKFITIKSTKIWTFASGQGIPLILCNGGPGCCDYLAPVAGLVDDMAHVIRFEQRGCGRSDADKLYDVQTCVDDLEQIRQQYGLDRWSIGGHSWGADLALAYALQYPAHTLGLICIAGGRINNDREWHKAYRAGKDAGLEPLPDFDFPANKEVNSQVNASWKQFIQNPTLLYDFGQLETPALFIYGEKDIRPSWPVEQLAHLMPNGRYQAIPNANHYIWLTHAEELKVHLRHFLQAF